MNRIRWALVAGMAIVVAIWLAAHRQIFFLSEVFAMRHEWILLTGLFAFAAMAVAVMLSVRPVSIEPPMGGLDKMYRLHKWLGVAALLSGTPLLSVAAATAAELHAPFVEIVPARVAPLVAALAALTLLAAAVPALSAPRVPIRHRSLLVVVRDHAIR